MATATTISVVSNFWDDTISVLLNRGDGTFVDAAAGAASYPVPFAFRKASRWAISMETGGPTSRWSPNTASGLAVLLNRGDGTFRPAVTYPVSALAVAIADLDADADNDVITGDGVVLLNDGHGVLGTPTSYLDDWTAFGVAIGDVDGDGDLDVATGDLNHTNIAVLHNAGDGTFPVVDTFAVSSGMTSVALADLTGDARADLVTLSSPIKRPVGARQRRHGSLPAGHALSHRSQPLPRRGGRRERRRRHRPHRRLDGVPGSDDCALGSLGVLLNQRDGTFESRRASAGDQPVSIASGDVDGDRDEDLAVVNSVEGVLEVLLNRGDATFSTGARLVLSFAFQNFPPRVALEDIDGDGDPDIVLALGRFPYWSLFRNSGRGRFGVEEVYLGTRSRNMGLVVLDLDRAHGPDVVALANSSFGERDADVDVFLNAGHGSFSTRPTATYAVPDGARALAGCDLNGDTFPDLVTANVALRDVDGDGVPDRVGSLGRLLNLGDGTFDTAVEIPFSGEPSFIAAADLTADGACDLAVVDVVGSSVLFFRNSADGTGTLAAPVRLPVGAQPEAIVVRDFDRDGMPDLGVANQDFGDETVSILLNDGDGAFTSDGKYRSGNTPFEDIEHGQPLAAADLDGDGDIDLAVANGEDDDVSILLNRSVRPEHVESVVLSGGGTVTTDDESDGPTLTDPVETTVTAPIGGGFSISEVPITMVPPPGFVFFGHQVDLIAPPSPPPGLPLSIDFEIDASRIPAGDDEGTISLFRNGVLVPACSGPPGVAEPDPCVAGRALLPDGDVRLSALTTEASAWTFGVYRLAVPVEFRLRIDGAVFGTDLIRVLIPEWRYRLLVSAVGDGDKNGREEMQGAILPFDALGTGSQAGPVQVRLRPAGPNPPLPAVVRLEEQGNKTPGMLEVFPFGPGDGTAAHGLLLELEFTAPKQVLHNLKPIELQSLVTQWPPRAGQDLILQNGPVALVDASGKPAGVVTAVTARFSLAVALDIKPGNAANSIKPSSLGSVPVAILSNAELNAPVDVDRSSLGFGRTGSEPSLVHKKKNAPSCTVSDVNLDGLPDLVCKFLIKQTGLQTGDVLAALGGHTIEGLPIEGSGKIRTPKPK